MKKLRQAIPPEQKYTLINFNAEFPNDSACLAHIAEQRWPGHRVECGSKKCGGKQRKHHRVTSRTAYACDYCGNHIYPLAGTIFADSSTSLRLWFYAIYLLGSTRCGISAKQLQRETGVTYKTAWRMFKQIRSLMAEDLQLSGPRGGGVEMDETYIGGVRKGKRGSPAPDDKKKTCVVGMVERKGRVIAVTTEGRSGATILGLAKERILPGSIVYTDEAAAYDGLTHMNRGYQHRRIHHDTKIYVVGDVYTNTIEGFWSLVKRGLGGVYHSVSKKYLQSYLNEYTYRYNRRGVPQPMFTSLLCRVSELAVAKPSAVTSETHHA